MKGARSTLYFALSEGFKEPTPAFTRDVVSGAFEGEIRGAFKELGEDVGTGGLKLEGEKRGLPEISEWFVDEYYALFKGPFPPYVVPVESVYKPWSKSPEAHEALREKKGLLMGDSAIEMLKRYRADGLEIPDSFRAYPDHIALLLEYGGLLCDRGSQEAQREFVLSHFDWVEELKKDIYEHTQNQFYRSLADVTLAFLNLERKRFQGNNMPEICQYTSGFEKDAPG